MGFTIPSQIPAAASTLIYYNLSDPNFDKLTVTWKGSEAVKNDPTAVISKAVIEVPTIKAGDLYVKSDNLFSTFSITNLQATNDQVFSPQAIIPNQYNFTNSFLYFNSATDSTVTAKNSIKFQFTPPYSPIYVYCALVCYNRNFPSDDIIKRFDNVGDNLTRYYSFMFNSKNKDNIMFNNLVRGQRYKLRCIISSTEGITEQRTS